MFSNTSSKIFFRMSDIFIQQMCKMFSRGEPTRTNATSGADQVCEFMCAKITTTAAGAAVVDTLQGSRLWKGKERPGAAAIFRGKTRSHDLSPRSRPRGRKMCCTHSCTAYRFSDCFSIVICAIYCNNCVNMCMCVGVGNFARGRLQDWCNNFHFILCKKLCIRVRLSGSVANVTRKSLFLIWVEHCTYWNSQNWVKYEIIFWKLNFELWNTINI